MERFKLFCAKNKLQLILTGCATLAIAAVVIILVVISGRDKISDEEESTVPGTSAAAATTAVPTTADPNAGKARSLLTGDYIDAKRAAQRPVAVMINNISEALPQSGIGNAGVIYEAPVEGGITRLMALFDDYSGLKKIGSIRSCRIYYCYFALEWDAVYCHYGQSKYAKDFLNSDRIDNVSSYNAGSYYYQTSDRVAPHNTYIDTRGIDGAIKALKYRRKYKNGYTGHFSFAPEEQPVDLADGVAAKTVEIAYPHNHPFFQYDKSSGQYLRYQLGEKHIDDQTNRQLSCKNILIQFVDASMYPDGKSLDITLTGSGSGYYITGGKSIAIKWSKDKQTGVTKYTDTNGNDITLNTGKTWICIVQNGTDVSIEE